MSDKRGSIIAFKALDCGHPVKCWSLEPTPLSCAKCFNAGRKILAATIANIGDIDTYDIPSVEDLDNWLDECGVTDPGMRKDIHELAGLCDDIRDSLDYAVRRGRQLLEKYPLATEP